MAPGLSRAAGCRLLSPSLPAPPPPGTGPAFSHPLDNGLFNLWFGSTQRLESFKVGLLSFLSRRCFRSRPSSSPRTTPPPQFRRSGRCAQRLRWEAGAAGSARGWGAPGWFGIDFQQTRKEGREKSSVSSPRGRRRILMTVCLREMILDVGRVLTSYPCQCVSWGTESIREVANFLGLQIKKRTFQKTIAALLGREPMEMRFPPVDLSSPPPGLIWKSQCDENSAHLWTEWVEFLKGALSLNAPEKMNSDHFMIQRPRKMRTQGLQRGKSLCISSTWV